MEEKRCSKCKRLFPATLEFFRRRNRNKKIGLEQQCKECRRQTQRKYYSVPRTRKRYAITPEAYAQQLARQKIYRVRPDVRERNRLRDQMRRALKKGITGTHTAQESKEQYQRQKGKCYYCQHKIEWGKHHEDHVIPLTRGGSNDISNIVIACPACNMRKYNKLPHEWLGSGRSQGFLL